MRASLNLDLFAARAEHASAALDRLARLLVGVAEELDADAIGLAGRRVEDRHVRLVDRQRLVDHAAGDALHRVRLDVLLDDVDALDDQALFVDAAHHRAAAALVAAGQHDDLVALTNLVHLDLPDSAAAAQSTSGASDTIFMKRSVRSSRVTGPKMRVPIGSSLALSSTAALPSNLTSEPSWRRTPLAVRTTTAE